ncbi:MAG: hypothetical protein JWN64_83 [Parcubacteria group bacterium]|nr:hypothetical protein [Parcubacteria group bacterium]
MSILPSNEDIQLLLRDKYEGDTNTDISADKARLVAGEPLAYVIGWIPFLGLKIHLNSKPLIPRPETEHWTEELIARLQERFGKEPFSILDLCAGSGAIGLAVLAKFPSADVSFSELMPEHVEQIKQNIEKNGLDDTRADIRISDLYAAFNGKRFDVVVSNPPYIPSERSLDESVTGFEPAEALFSGEDGLDLIRRIATETPSYLKKDGELWLEADIENIEEARRLIHSGKATDTEIRTDQYGRARLVVAHYT